MLPPYINIHLSLGIENLIAVNVAVRSLQFVLLSSMDPGCITDIDYVGR